MRLLVIIAAALFILGVLDLRLVRAQEPGTLVLLDVRNPACAPNELFRACEDYYSPRVKELRERYGLDKVVAGETDELRRILLLRHWIHANMRIDNEHPTPTRGDVFGILDAARQGGGFHCAHFSIVQHAVLNSFGYVARRLGCGPGLNEKGGGGHHGVNEVWVNSLAKWMIIDAKYDIHFEKGGVPLSALEIRDEVIKDGGKSVVVVEGVDRKPVEPKPGEPSWERRAETYRWCSWETSTNHFTAFPAPMTSTLVVYEDDFFRKNTWYRDGKPHWAYGTPYFTRTPQRGWIEWTPNTIASKASIKDGKLSVFLESFTPNFRSYQMKRDDGEWADCGERVDVDLAGAGLPGRSNGMTGQSRTAGQSLRFAFRAVNLFGVTGPEHRVEVGRK